MHLGTALLILPSAERDTGIILNGERDAGGFGYRVSHGSPLHIKLPLPYRDIRDGELERVFGDSIREAVGRYLVSESGRKEKQKSNDGAHGLLRHVHARLMLGGSQEKKAPPKRG